MSVDTQVPDVAGVRRPLPDRTGPAAFPFEATHYVWREVGAGGAPQLTPVMCVDRWAYSERSWNANADPEYVAAWSAWRDRTGARVNARLVDPHREGRFAWETQPFHYRRWFFPHERFPEREFLITHWVQETSNAPREEVMAIDGVAYTRGAWDWREPPEFLVALDGTLREFPDDAALPAGVDVEALPPRYAGWLDRELNARLACVEASGVRDLGGLPWGVGRSAGSDGERRRLAAVLVTDAVGADSGIASRALGWIADRLRGLSPIGPWFLAQDTVRAWASEPAPTETQVSPSREPHPFLPTHEFLDVLSTGDPVARPVMVVPSAIDGRRRAYDERTWRTAAADARLRGDVAACAEFDNGAGVWRRCNSEGQGPECIVDRLADHLVGWTDSSEIRRVFRCTDEGVVELSTGERSVDWTTPEGRALVANEAALLAGVDTRAETWRLLAIDAEVAKLNTFCWLRNVDEIQQWADVPPPAPGVPAPTDPAPLLASTVHRADGLVISARIPSPAAPPMAMDINV